MFRSIYFTLLVDICQGTRHTEIEVSEFNTALFNSTTYHGEYQEREFVRNQDPQ